ncbi:MAG: NnrS family protein [Pseudomonadota bacterium]
MHSDARLGLDLADWHKVAFFSYGFRPFFLGAAIWAVVSMVLWLLMLSGVLELPIAIDIVSWHAHAFLFGYLLACVAGFLLTAVPNWTKRPPIAGGVLAMLFGLWLAGRVAFAMSGLLPPLVVLGVDLAMPAALAGLVVREIVLAGNWRNLVVVVMLIVLMTANVVFHLEAMAGEYAATGLGVRLGLAAAVMMIALIGGRIVPTFTRNWLKKRGEADLPPEMGIYDKICLLALVLILGLWVAMPEERGSGLALLAAGALHLIRLARWRGMRTYGEPLVWVLHAGYVFIPLGALALGAAVLVPDLVPPPTAQHLWMAGAIGMMTLAVMTRASLGHTGRVLTAGSATMAVYLSLIDRSS